MTWFQWDNGNVEATTCMPGACDSDKPTYWAWDRFLGAWVHYRA